MITLLALLPTLALVCPPSALSGTLAGSAAVGFDSYNENYSVLQVSSLNQLNEVRTRLRLSYLAGKLFQDNLSLEGQTLVGQESLEAAVRAGFAKRLGRTRVTMENILTNRSYLENTTYSFANDFFQYDLRATARRDIRPGLTVGLISRTEVINFDERTEFDYDYVRSGIEAAVTIDRGLTSSYQATLGYVTKMIPDSTEISYDAYTAGLEYRHTLGLSRQISFSIDAERRVYSSRLTRSPFWSVYSAATLQPVTFGRFGLRFDNVFESYQFDQSSSIFFNYIENRSVAQLTYFDATVFTIGAGPAYGFLRSGLSSEDEYTEIGAKISLDWNSGGKLWLSASYEPGRRDYALDPISDAFLFSDFVYHRVLVFATLNVVAHTSLNLFANFEPEDHAIPTEDTTTTLLSADITYRF